MLHGTNDLERTLKPPSHSRFRGGIRCYGKSGARAEDYLEICGCLLDSENRSSPSDTLCLESYAFFWKGDTAFRTYRQFIICYI